MVSLNGTEIFDCLEQDYLSKNLSDIARRHIFKKFDFNLMIKSDNRNNTNYTVSTSKID